MLCPEDFATTFEVDEPASSVMSNTDDSRLVTR
jgi:hypothetical protein